MLEEADKAISSFQEINTRLETTILKLFRHMVGFDTKYYKTDKYIFEIHFKNFNALNGRVYEGFLKLTSKEECFSIFKRKKTINKTILLFFLRKEFINNMSIKQAIIEDQYIYFREKPIGFEDIEKVIDFLSIFAEDMSLKTKNLLTHQDQIKAFDELLEKR